MSFDTAIICLNGHVMNPRSETLSRNNFKFCKKCGEPGISTCPQCSGKIHGMKALGRGWAPFLGPAAYCHECGKPYPWTERALAAARELIELSTLSHEEKSDYNAAIADLTKDTPKTQVALVKFKTLSIKAGTEIAKGVRDITVNIASEVIKKALIGS
jgi:hypothetical protein